MSDKHSIVTIDGPSGVGKSTISRRVAAAVGYTYLDTGAMYRAVGLRLHRNGIDLSDEQAISANLAAMVLELLPGLAEADDVRVIMDGEDVSRDIRTPEAAMVASQVSALPVVRARLTEMQRDIGNKGSIVAEGRDTGTVVFPAARYKFYLDADPRERARRRADQLRGQGKTVDEESLYTMIVERDKNDQERTIAPLKKADDAIVVDTTRIDIDQVTEKILTAIKEIDLQTGQAVE